jgi:membrane associated rhomboid family serine protease
MRRDQWHVTEGLIFAHFAVFLLTAVSDDSLEGAFRALAVIPGTLPGEPWRLVTYQFIHGASMFWFFISMLVLWIMARPLEENWGSPRFMVFWLISTFGASLTATALGLPLAGDVGFATCLLFTFATLYPEVEFRLFFLIPVKVKYLAIIAGAWLVFSSLSLGLLGGAANIAGTSAGYLFFLATRKLPSRRKLAFELNKRKADMAVRAESSQAESQNAVWDPQVRAAVERAASAGAVAAEDEPLLGELDAAKDESITVCAPSEFGFIDDDVCRSCVGYAECAARKIRMTAEEKAQDE